MLCEISRETRGNREARRESGTRERERSRGEAIREEKGAKYRAPIIKPRLFVCEPAIATPVPRHAVRNYRDFRVSRGFASTWRWNQTDSFFRRTVTARWYLDSVTRSLSSVRFSPFFFFFTQSVIRKSSIPCTLLVQEINIQVFLSVDKSRSHRSLVQGKDKKFIMEVRNR